MRFRPALAMSIGLVACLEEGATRPQTLVVVDTDLFVAPGSEPRVAAMDTLRVDVLTERGTSIRETREYVVSDPSAWPFSLGVVGPARLRLRLFAARWSETGTDSRGVRTREPRAEVAVDRLVVLEGPEEGKNEVRVVLAGDCLGRAADLGADITCIDGATLRAPASTPLAPDDARPPRLGSWLALRETPCTSPAPTDRPCIAGGFDVLGDLALSGLASRAEDPTPLRPVALSPFRMDRLEYTVGRYRAAVRAGRVAAVPAPRMATARSGLEYCTFRGADDATADAMPLNCVGSTLAQSLCAAEGGRLPTEAEWEHAASGRGEGRIFPWGSRDPTCCTASLSRSPDPSVAAPCGPLGLEAAGSHLGGGCKGGGDVSRDGIVDLGGSLFELTSDTLVAVRECTKGGVARDPVCNPSGPGLVKSADFSSGFVRARVALRTVADSEGTSTQGFRCAYPEPR